MNHAGVAIRSSDSLQPALKSRPRRKSAWAAAFFICLLFFTASGRLASSDAGAELQAAMLLATTGSLGTDQHPGGVAGGLFLRAPNHGRFYEVHDLGNHVLMFPAALAGSTVSRATKAEDVTTPPLASRVGVAFTYALLCAIAASFLFRLFQLGFSDRAALLLAGGLVATTIFWVYTKSANDVVGAACFVVPMLYYAARASLVDDPRGSFVLAALAGGLACTFRFSLAPFVVIGLAILPLLVSRLRTLGTLSLAAGVFLICMLPSFVYNDIRMGSFVRPATAAHRFVKPGGANELGGNPAEGFLGLLASPNRGVLWFSPILLLLFVLPFVWQRLEQPWRTVLIAFGPTAILYLLFISALVNWGGTFGWGPRYVLPVLPILYLGAAVTAAQLWARRRKPVAVLCGISILLSAVPMLVNWNLASAVDARNVDQGQAWPRQEYVVWKGFVRGITGKSLPLPPGVEPGSIRAEGAKFPDLWLARFAERRSLYVLPAALIGLALIAGALLAWRRVVASEPSAPPHPS